MGGASEMMHSCAYLQQTWPQLAVRLGAFLARYSTFFLFPKVVMLLPRARVSSPCG